MEFKFNDSTLWEHKENRDRDENTYMILSKLHKFNSVKNLLSICYIITQSY